MFFWAGQIAELVGASEPALTAYARCAEIDPNFSGLLEQKHNEMMTAEEGHFVVSDDARLEFSDLLSCFLHSLNA